MHERTKGRTGEKKGREEGRAEGRVAAKVVGRVAVRVVVGRAIRFSAPPPPNGRRESYNGCGCGRGYGRRMDGMVERRSIPGTVFIIE